MTAPPDSEKGVWPVLTDDELQRYYNRGFDSLSSSSRELTWSDHHHAGIRAVVAATLRDTAAAFERASDKGIAEGKAPDHWETLSAAAKLLLDRAETIEGSTMIVSDFKKRVVSEEELDGLPDRTAVLDSDGNFAILLGEQAHVTTSDGGHDERKRFQLSLPVTILSMPN